MDLSPWWDVWHRVIGSQPAPPPLVVLATAAVGLLAVLPRPVWRLTRNVITIAHEGGHALAAVLTGRKLRGIKLHSDTSGLTLSAGRPTGAGMVLTLLAGFITPSLLGLAGAALLAANRSTMMLWLSMLLLLCVLVLIRNAYGLLSVLVTGAVVFAVSWWASAAWQGALAYAGVFFLLFGGVRPVGELRRLRRRGRAPDSDADQLARVTRVPGLVWLGVFGTVTIVALALGVLLLAQPLLDLVNTSRG